MELLFTKVYDPQKFQTIQNYRIKPIGGLWTSPFRDGKSPWIDYLEAIDWDFEDTGTVLTLKTNARILQIDTFHQLKKLYRHFRLKTPIKFRPYLDYERITKKYDAIYWTQAAEDEAWRDPEYCNYTLMLDCATVLILNQNAINAYKPFFLKNSRSENNGMVL